jgi:hypothetical protein
MAAITCSSMNSAAEKGPRRLDFSSHGLIVFPELWDSEPDISELSLAHNQLQV